MAKLALAQEFMAGFGKLEQQIRNRVSDLVDKCSQMTMQELNGSKGLHLETYKGQKDPRARTIRLGDNHRGIVLVPGGSDQLVLVSVLKHDDADRWMTQNEFKVNAATGALEIVNAGALAEESEAILASTVPGAPSSEAKEIFGHRRDKDFVQLGIDDTMVSVVRALRTEDQVLTLATALPQGQGEALLALTSNDSVESIYSAIAGDIDPADIDPDDLGKALEAPASQGHFHVVTDEDDLAEMLARPLAQWRTFLHHSQHDLAYRPTYNGPVRVTGGAGTGKTVVAMHRAKALADQVEAGPSKPILFTTFTRNLAQGIERDLNLLGGADLLDVVEVTNVDSLASQVVKSVDGSNPSILEGDGLEALWQNAIDELGVDVMPGFVLREYEQVVLAQGIDSREEYFKASRAGRGVRLDRRGRAEVWKVIELATGRMDSSGVCTYLQVAAKAAGYLAAEPVKPYRHVIVDEAQDLHEVQWRLLRAAVAKAPNDLFLVGDSHQRIYDRRSSLGKAGIDIVGRSKRLKINYRTTRQILRWSLAILDHPAAVGFDDPTDADESQDVAGYHSFLEGPAPTTAAFTTRGEMLDGLVAQVAQWIDGGVDESDIVVVARVNSALAPTEERLKAAGIQAFRLGPALNANDGVAIGTMHRMKGFEARCVAIIGASADQLPLPYALTPQSEDPGQRASDLMRERSLLYVAATRARDDLWVAWHGSPSPFLDPVLTGS